jgi:protease I
LFVPSWLDTRGVRYPIPQFPDDDPNWLAGARVLFISADGPELPEIDVPMGYLKARGATVVLAGQNWILKYRKPAGYIVLAEWLSDNVAIKADVNLTKVKVEQYHALFIP